MRWSVASTGQTTALTDIAASNPDVRSTPKADFHLSVLTGRKIITKLGHSVFLRSMTTLVDPTGRGRWRIEVARAAGAPLATAIPLAEFFRVDLTA